MSTDADLKPNPAELPDDPAFLKPLIVQLFETLQKSQQRVRQLEHHMDLLLRRVFGKSSEKLDPRQLVLAFSEVAAELSAETTSPATSEPPAAADVSAANTAKKKGHGRRRTPDTLVRVEQVHDLSDEQKQTLGGEPNLVLIGEEVSEQIEWEADAFSGYDGIYLDAQGAIVEVACWAHARRKFFESRDSDSQRANLALARIRQLYEIERRVLERIAGDWRDRPLSERAAQIAAIRQQDSRPILAEFRTWLDEQSTQVLPKSPIAAALRYALNQWDALCRYTDDGQLAIDNNAAERTLRALAIGRKNWLFVGSEHGGHTAATILTLITSATRHHLDPFAYLRDLLRRLPTTAQDDLINLLPNHWQPA